MTRTAPMNGQGWLTYLWLILAHGFMFGMLGPAIGTLLSPGVLIFPIAVVFAYIVSFIPAVATGLTVGMLAPFVRQASALYPLAILTGAALSVAIPFAFATHTRGMEGVMAMYAIAGAFAALVCTRLTRFIRVRWLTE